MNFRIAARVVSQLGAELISSDEIAIYELVKNGFDARSATVEVHVNYRASLSIVQDLQGPALHICATTGTSSPCPAEIKGAILAKLAELQKAAPKDAFLIATPEHLGRLAARIKSSTSAGEVANALGELNSVDIIDYGHGMSKADVERYYLTIGTTHRLNEVEGILQSASTDWVPAGEKGIGRLSAMRLGQLLEMYTVPEQNPEAVVVEINWREFQFRKEDNLTDIPVRTEVRLKGNDKAGTFISISNLTSDWPRDKVVTLGVSHLAKFIDPFPANGDSARTPRKIVLKWNGETLECRELIRRFLEGCQNSMRCRMSFRDGKALLDSTFVFGEVRTNPRREFSRVYSVVDFSGLTDADLQEVGPFELLLFHFPRNRLRAIPLFASRQEIKNWLDRWCGGLMVFRDGVRVLPYAAPGDDWLNLDGQALRGRGFRVNRIQVVGCVRISRVTNPQLIDQTNREGFRENRAYHTFWSLVSRHLQENFVSELGQHLGSERPDFEHLSRQVAEEYDLLSQCAEDLKQATGTLNWDLARESSSKLRNVLEDLRELNDVVEKALQDKEGNRIQVLELAATGMAAESMAHDLEGVIETAITSLNEAAFSAADSRTAAAAKHIRSVHNALLIQLKQISPGPARSRRRSSRFDLLKVVREAASFYEERMRRHGISLVLPAENETLTVQAVNGHICQILDNLFRNAIFWLQDTRRKFPEHPSLQIEIKADTAGKILLFTDTGIGIAREDKDWVFGAFNSRRHDGRGLGLFICKELADFNKVKLSLVESDLNSWGRLRTFRMEFSD